MAEDTRSRDPATLSAAPGGSGAPRGAVVALAAATGLFAQTAQIVMFREMLAACRGTEVFFGVVLAAGLGWTALGSLLAGLFARRGVRRKGQAWRHRAWAFAAALFALNGVLLVGQIALARHRASGAAAELTFAQAALTAVLATAPVAVACGAEFVLALHAAKPEAFGRLYQADAWGAVLGGVLFTFVLVGLVDPVTLGPLLGAGLCLLVHLAGGRRWMATGFVLGLVAAAGVWVYGLDHRLHVRRWRALHPGYRLAATADSRYGQLAVLRHPRVPQHSLYHDGGLVETLPPPDAPATDARNAALFAVSQHPQPRDVLLIGRALGHLPAELLRMKIERLDALELDPALFALASRFAVPTEDPRLRRVFQDARRYAKHAGRGKPTAYDVIIVGAPPPLSAFVNRMYTVEFFREARRAMGREGVLITSVMAAANYPGETVGQLSASVLRSLQEAFPEVLVAPGETHTFVAGTRRGLVSLDPAVLARRIAARGIWVPDADPDFRDAAGAYYTARFQNLIVTSQVARLRETLDAIPAPVNTDARPITYQYALLVWNQIVSARTQARDPGLRGGTNALFRAALRLRFGHGLVLPAILLLPAAALVVVGRRRARRTGPAYGVLATAFATGLFGMAAEIILLYAFQAAHGYAYAQVGAIVASFMVGLALGARVGTRWERQAGFLTAVVGAMVVYCALLPLALRGVAGLGGSLGSLAWLSALPFFLLVFGAGFLDGATFPPLVGSLRGLGYARPGAWVYASDLAGAGVGALATGALLVPVLGNALALGLVAATLAAALLAFLPVFRARSSRS